MKNKVLKLLSVVLATVISLSMITVTNNVVKATNSTGSSRYKNVDANEISNLGNEPEELAVNSYAKYAEKDWYEYITYAEKPVATYRLDDSSRLLFYDPYEYSSAMIMQVEDSGEWETASSLEYSYSYSKTMELGEEKSKSTSTTTQTQKGKDESVVIVDSTTTKKTEYNHQEITAEANAKAGTKVTSGFAEVTAEVETKAGIKDYVGDDTDTETVDSTTSGWSKLADRITTTTGSVTSTNTTWSTSETITYNKVYHATHFSELGSPYSWKVVKYEVKMPMKYELQYLLNGEWVTTDSSYCVITTMKGSCRAWMENNTAYYEHWGNGKAVVWQDFWSGFISEENLISAYTSKLYPDF